MSERRPTIAIAGLTHLGINTAAAFAERGFATAWFDPDQSLVQRIGQGKLPVVEPDLDDLVDRNRHRIRLTVDPADLAACDVVYIAADVPTDDAGTSDLAPIQALIETVWRAVATSSACVVVLCQVPPGFSRGLGLPGDRLFYQVETLIFGRAVQRALHPERYIVGCADPLRPLPEAYRTLLEAFGCPLLTMRYESAELAKIAINCCLVAQVSTANTLAELCERIGANWSEIVPALKLDRRIGAFAYLAPGLGIAGGNLERDLATVITLADIAGSDAGVVRAWVENSRYRKDWCYRELQGALYANHPRARLGVLGLAYKEETHSTKNAPSLALLERLKADGREVAVYDPQVDPAIVPFAEAAAEPMAAVRNADALVIITPWATFRTLDPRALAAAMRGRLLLDPYRVLDEQAARAAGFDYRTLGVPARN